MQETSCKFHLEVTAQRKKSAGLAEIRSLSYLCALYGIPHRTRYHGRGEGARRQILGSTNRAFLTSSETRGQKVLVLF